MRYPEQPQSEFKCKACSSVYQSPEFLDENGRCYFESCQGTAELDLEALMPSAVIQVPEMRYSKPNKRYEPRRRKVLPGEAWVEAKKLSPG